MSGADIERHQWGKWEHALGDRKQNAEPDLVKCFPRNDNASQVHPADDHDGSWIQSAKLEWQESSEDSQQHNPDSTQLNHEQPWQKYARRAQI